MDEGSRNDLRRELAVLQAEEERLSAERDRLHHQIDFGFESSTTREREVSAARRDLHQRIRWYGKSSRRARSTRGRTRAGGSVVAP